MKRIALALLASFAFAATTAHAVEYGEVQPDKSRIAFDYQQMGVAMQGTFGKFASALRFDPAAPQTASARIEVELASVDTGSEEGDDEVARKTWFDTKGFPVARFESSTVKPLGENQYEVAGKLTIKGTTKDVVVPATFTPQGGSGVFEGALTIRRGDFSIGEGAWKAFDVVANDVVIRFRITAAAR
jgi:polyisoprenoid-binding protein YceI